MISPTNIVIALATLQAANASLFMTFPVQGSTCAVGQACQVKWKDSNDQPPLSSLGEVAIDLVSGDASDLKPVQSLGGVTNPASALAITFQPAANLSPTQKYAIRFIPKNNPGGVIFSTFFTITGGTGTGNGTATKSTTSLATISNSSSLANSSAANITSAAKSVLSNSTLTNSSSAAHNSSSAANATASANAPKSASSFLTASVRAVVGVAALSLALLL